MLNQKNNPHLYDFIIVGQGIAGSVLALSLIRSGYSVCVINQPSLSSCSRVAAGIWNPVVFKRLTKSWLADDIVPELIDFYRYYETEFNTSLIHLRPIIKPFSEEQEKKLWVKKAQSENEFLDKKTYENFPLNAFQQFPSYSKVLKAGNLEVSKFLDMTKNYITSKQFYIEEVFDYDLVQHSNRLISYKSITAKNIVFCDGHLISNNPYFNWIPMKPAKGETITITCKELSLGNSILNKGIFILPLGNNTFKIGATYEWENLSDIPTEKAKHDLEQKIRALISIPFEIIHQEAGIRPSVIDRRPLVGKHPELANYYIFNGFGTKGVMLAPYFAKAFIHHYNNHSPINSEVNPNRFYKK